MPAVRRSDCSTHRNKVRPAPRFATSQAGC